MERGFQTPDVKEVSRMLTFLLGRRVKVQNGSRLRVGARDKWTLCVYTAEDGSMVGACATDLPMAVNAGAALSLFPPHKAEASIARNIIDGTMWENALEVYNVISRFFHDAKPGMVQVGASYAKGEDVPLEIKKFMRRAQQRIDLRVHIAGYGMGSMALLG